MTSIQLRSAIIKAYLGSDRFNGCQDISRIHLQVENSVASVKARIPASSTRQRDYSISVQVCTDGRAILGSSCTCPIGYKCKHINKVLHRIRESPRNPIQGPSQEYLAGVARRQHLSNLTQRGACVYMALACKSELDSGSDFRRSYFIKDNFDQEILGVFFSAAAANRCAKNYVENELGQSVGDDEDDMEEDDVDDDDGDFVWDGSDYGIFDEDYPNSFNKVWVECRAIEDASHRFRP